VLGLTYTIIRIRWPNLGQSFAVTVGTLVAAPLALALLWDRLGGFKVLGIEVTLSQASSQVEAEVVGAVTATQYFSGKEAIVEQITQAIMRPEQELLEINLRDGGYWWSTRLFLVAALAEDYSGVQRLVFVEGGLARNFVGMAPPGQVRQALTTLRPILEPAYQQIKRDPPAQPGVSRLGGIVLGWTQHAFRQNDHFLGEQDLVDKVSPALLSEWLAANGRFLEKASVDWTGITDPYVIRSLLFECDSRFVALLRDGRLDRVVNRLDLAVRVARRAIG
jgi:hypothetical protein